jgi:hypothetical protein
MGNEKNVKVAEFGYCEDNYSDMEVDIAYNSYADLADKLQEMLSTYNPEDSDGNEYEDADEILHNIKNLSEDDAKCLEENGELYLNEKRDCWLKCENVRDADKIGEIYAEIAQTRTELEKASEEIRSLGVDNILQLPPGMCGNAACRGDRSGSWHNVYFKNGRWMCASSQYAFKNYDGMSTKKLRAILKRIVLNITPEVDSEEWYLEEMD